MQNSFIINTHVYKLCIEGTLEETLISRLEQLQVDFKNDDPRSSFVNECLNMLIDIQKALLQVCVSGGEFFLHNLFHFNNMGNLESQGEKDYLGVRDFRLIHTLLQVIISWGFYPCFLPGVGVPLSKRVKSGYTNHGKTHTNQLHE